MTKLICVGGARPNFMKLAPLVKVLREAPDFQVVLVHTGQHYDEKMSDRFFRELGLPDPDHHLQVGSASHAQQTAEILKRFERVVKQERPDGVLVVGDVNSTMAAAIVAAKLRIQVVHVEAGLRSFDRSMPEEINRLVTDAIADFLLVTEESGLQNLLREGVPESRIRVVGNLMIDTLHQNLERAQRESKIAADLRLADGRYGVVTLHRPANVDDSAQLNGILKALGTIAQELPLYFPVHPRTRSRISDEASVESSSIRMMEPLGYIDFLALMSRAALVLTDSGGIQEETTALGIPCLTLRDNTERPVTIEQGTNMLAGTVPDAILEAWRVMRAAPKQGRIPRFWDGKAAQRCLEALRDFFESRNLECARVQRSC